MPVILLVNLYPCGNLVRIERGIMFLFCLLRMWKAGVKVLWTPFFQSFLYAPETGAAAVAGDGEGRGGSAGGADDPASRLVTFALSQKLLLDGDAEGWSEVGRIPTAEDVDWISSRDNRSFCGGRYG